MEERELNRALRSVKEFQGSFALDELKHLEIKSLPDFFVINLDNRWEKGSHWIGVCIYHNAVYVCDSLGGLIPGKQFPHDLINFLHIHTFNRKLFITKQLQPTDSDLCGAYCILFIREMTKHDSFSSFLSLFTNNLKQNDKIVSFLCNLPNKL